MNRSVAGSVRIRVEVAYAEPERQWLIALELPVGASVGEAVAASGLAQRFPAWREAPPAMGIWGRPVSADQRLQDGDRVELYRSLSMDPKTARRRRAASG